MRRALAVVLLAAAAAASPAPAAPPKCFAAAARDPENPCRNPALRDVARPRALRAQLTPSHPCKPAETLGTFEKRETGALTICHFGVPARRATRTVALIGDSHAMAWRAAVAGTMRELGWHGIDMTRSHCAFSAAVRDLPEPEEGSGCLVFNRRVIDWLTEHPEVSAAFVGHQTGGTPYVAWDGMTSWESEVAGFAAAWDTLPPSIEAVYAIRDNPALRGSGVTASCIKEARRKGRDLGRYCALPRKTALRDDAFIPAAAALGDPRVAIVDLTDFMCSLKLCFPVIGGALVYKDGRHLTRVFSRSLGPYLARAVLAAG